MLGFVMQNISNLTPLSFFPPSSWQYNHHLKNQFNAFSTLNWWQAFCCDQTTASELSSETAVGMPSTVRSTDYPENATLNSSLSMNPAESQEYVQVQPLSFVETPPSPIISLPANQSDHVSMVTKLHEQAQEQAQKLPSSGFLSSNDGLSTLPSGAPTSTVIQNPAVEQPTSNSEVGSQSRQVVSNMDIDSPVPCGIRAQSSETINPGLRNHPIEAAPQSSVKNLPPLYHNPLCHELERIQKMVSFCSTHCYENSYLDFISYIPLMITSILFHCWSRDYFWNVNFRSKLTNFAWSMLNFTKNVRGDYRWNGYFRIKLRYLATAMVLNWTTLRLNFKEHRRGVTHNIK